MRNFTLRVAFQGVMRVWKSTPAMIAVALILAPGAFAAKHHAKPLTVPSGWFLCRQAGETVTNDASRLAIGNCDGPAPGQAGSSLDRTVGPTPVLQFHTWAGGEVFGSFGDYGTGCGWLYGEFNGRPTLQRQTAQPHGSGAAIACADPTIPIANFVDTDTQSGQAYGPFWEMLKNDTTCPEYANYGPWSPDAHPTNALALDNTGAPGKIDLEARYVARYPYNGVYYAMVLAHGRGTGQYEWTFIPTTCAHPVGKGAIWP